MTETIILKCRNGKTLEIDKLLYQLLISEIEAKENKESEEKNE